MLKFSRSDPSLSLNGRQLTKPEKNLESWVATKPLRVAVEDARGVVEHAAAEPAVGHGTDVAVLAEVVEEERPLGVDQPLDRLDQELVGERRLEPAHPDLERRVVVQVDEVVEPVEGVEAPWATDTK